MRNELDVDLGMVRFLLDRLLPINPLDLRRIVVVITVEVVEGVAEIGTTEAGDEGSSTIVIDMVRLLGLALRRDVTETEMTVTAIPDISIPTCVHAIPETTVTCGIVKSDQDSIELRMSRLRYRLRTSHLLRLRQLLPLLGQYPTEPHQ